MWDQVNLRSNEITSLSSSLSFASCSPGYLPLPVGSRRVARHCLPPPSSNLYPPSTPLPHPHFYPPSPPTHSSPTIIQPQQALSPALWKFSPVVFTRQPPNTPLITAVHLIDRASQHLKFLFVTPLSPFELIWIAKTKCHWLS